MKKSLLLCLSVLGLYFPASAFNARGGEVNYRCVGGLTYEFEITVWGEFLNPSDSICFMFGDNVDAILTGANAFSDVSLASALPSNFSNIHQVVWRISHAYSSPGIYTQYLSCIKRVAGIGNIPNSVSTTLFLSTQIAIDPNVGCNSAPSNLNTTYMFFPLMSQSNSYNLNYFDADGDSLSYSFGPCNEPGYTYPHVLAGGTYSMNSTTGQFSWNAPMTPGIYNMMLRVDQWKHFGNMVVNIGTHEQEIQFVVDAMNGVEEETNESITVFPNPGSSSIKFQLTNSTATEMRIIDQLGREVCRQKLNEDRQIEISIADLPNGMYFYQCIGNDKIIGSGKFIVQH